MLESGAGKGELARKSNNHFGIKCHGWQGRKTYHDDDERNECFRAYDSPGQSYEDHSKFLVQSQRYRRLFSLKTTDYKGWAHGLKACGYATNPAYAKKLIDIIELYKLYKYDSARGYDKFMAKHASEDSPAFKGGTELSWRKLAKYNERNKRDVLKAGDIIYLKKKRRHAEKAYKNRPHTIKVGESMYDIAQKYGIRLKSLYKMNHLSPDYQIKPGSQLRVY